MRIDDQLALTILEKDMHFKGVTEYTLIDTVVDNPTMIEIATNQVLYITALSTEQEEGADFEISFDSPTASVKYDSQHMERSYLNKIGGDELYVYHSSQVSSHWASVSVRNPDNIGFKLRYLLVTIVKRKMRSEI